MPEKLKVFLNKKCDFLKLSTVFFVGLVLVGSFSRWTEGVTSGLQDQELKRVFLAARPVGEIREKMERLSG